MRTATLVPLALKPVDSAELLVGEGAYERAEHCRESTEFCAHCTKQMNERTARWCTATRKSRGCAPDFLRNSAGVLWRALCQ